MNHCKKWTLGSYNQQRGFYEPTPCNDKFDTVREGTQETITRPAFRAGTVIIKDYTDVKLPTDIRRGLGNYTLIRENFVAPPLMPRVAVDFDKLNAQDLEAQGIKVQLGAKTIEQLFKTYVKDNTDVEWLNEYRRRRATGETSQQLIDNPPFGREQRKVSKITNFADQSVDLDTKLQRISSSVRQGRDETKVEMANIAAEVARILTNVGNLDTMTSAQLAAISAVINRMSLPKSPQTAGFTHRIFTIRQYRAQQGLINLFLLSNVDQNRSLEEPLLSSQANGTFVTMKISSMVTALGRPGAGAKYLDLETRTVISQQEAYALANAGVDNGQIDDQDPPGGQWV
jgi:hypothetical protein